MQKLIIVTKQGQILKIDPKDLRETKRGGSGVRAIRLAEGDMVMCTVVVNDG